MAGRLARINWEQYRLSVAEFSAAPTATPSCRNRHELGRYGVVREQNSHKRLHGTLTVNDLHSWTTTVPKNTG